jgi:hypothetical protein
VLTCGFLTDWDKGGGNRTSEIYSKYISEMKNIQKGYNYKCTKSNNKWNNSINTLTNGIQKDNKDMINHSLLQFRLYAK